VSPNLLSPSPTYSATKLPENTDEPDGPKQAAEGAIQMELHTYSMEQSPS